MLTPTPTTPNFNCNSPPFLIKMQCNEVKNVLWLKKSMHLSSLGKNYEISKANKENNIYLEHFYWEKYK